MTLKCFLIDIDGVLRLGNMPVEGAIEILDFLKENYKCLLVTNTTRYSLSELIKNLKDLGFKVTEKDILTAGSAAIDYIKSIKKNAKCFVIVEGGLTEDFKKQGLKVVKIGEPADFVVLGHNTKVNYNMLDAAYRYIMQGADFIATHKMRTYKREDGTHITVGVFVKGLEYATGKEAVVIGKPYPNFFRLGMEKINTENGKTAMIGDDIFDDIQGAQKCGLKTIFVETGSYKKEDLKKHSIRPDFVLSSISEIKNILK